MGQPVTPLEEVQAQLPLGLLVKAAVVPAVVAVGRLAIQVRIHRILQVLVRAGVVPERTMARGDPLT